MEEALQRSGGRALIFSNELVDAFPCRLFEHTDTAWRELGVSLGTDGSLSEVFLEKDPDQDEFHAFRHLPKGQRIERHDSYRDWLVSWRHAWKEGSLLTIDYGDTEEHLYEKRPRGSLRAYWKHQRYTGMDVYARFGRQDITSDINFSALMRWGEECRWKTLCLSSQREFLKKWLPEKRGADASDRFTHPDDAGDAFRILEQQSQNR